MLNRFFEILNIFGCKVDGACPQGNSSRYPGMQVTIRMWGFEKFIIY